MKTCPRCKVTLTPSARNVAAQNKGRSLGWGSLSGTETVVHLDEYEPHICQVTDERTSLELWKENVLLD